MTDSSTSEPLADLPGGPYNIEFFFDPACPFAWQTSVWARRVAELEDIRIGWRFISLKFINEDPEDPEGSGSASESRMRALRFHRVCAAARDRLGNEAVGDLYRTFGERFWYVTSKGEYSDRTAVAYEAAGTAEILAALDLPADLIKAAEDDSWDPLIRAESEEAFRRTGPDVGTPIITFDPPNGNSLFGPVISSIPDDETSVNFYKALRVFADFPQFSELKRTKRAPLDLPLLAE